MNTAEETDHNHVLSVTYCLHDVTTQFRYWEISGDISSSFGCCFRLVFVTKIQIYAWFEGYSACVQWSFSFVLFDDLFIQFFIGFSKYPVSLGKAIILELDYRNRGYQGLLFNKKPLCNYLKENERWKYLNAWGVITIYFSSRNVRFEYKLMKFYVLTVSNITPYLFLKAKII